ncbi:MAG TPA: adenine phosphoribosyltransferase [Arenimonas sp.]|nr:adenine phosphoribosyltransferase [Arenimonas sp.]HPW33903.1 adenine phosphoribosyltransferase [Arenimonas sp.]
MSVSQSSLQSRLLATIRTVPDWPKTGVHFRDITPLFQSPDLWAEVISHFVERYKHRKIDAIAGLEARGFILGAALAHSMNLPFIPIRKKGKLPYKTLSEDYDLEYGTATMEIHTDACRPGDKVLLADDLIATGGTLLAGKKLLDRIGAEVIEAAVVIDLPYLGGAEKCRASGLPVYALIQFDGD